MATTTQSDIYKKYLPENLHTIAINFDIPEKFLIQDTELVVMILKSRSIDTQEEKQNWFNLLPLMNKEQLDRLRAILVKEITKLKEIEEKYAKKKEEIQQKHLNQWEEKGYIKKVKSIEEKEQAQKQKDLEEADDMLDLI